MSNQYLNNHLRALKIYCHKEKREYHIFNKGKEIVKHLLARCHCYKNYTCGGEHFQHEAHFAFGTGTLMSKQH